MTWWLAMLGGVLGSSHCLGMCGPFAAVIGLRTTSLGGNLRAQLIYSLGRLMTYGCLGGMAGFAGNRLATMLPSFVNGPALLSLFAGLFLIREGLLAAGWLRGAVTGTSAGGCLMGGLFRTILRAPGERNTFLAGVATGLLPCGLVYAFLSLAASSGEMLQGMGLMLAFGAGTIPMMVVAGCGASQVGKVIRTRLWPVAAWSVVLTGVLTVGRGMAFLQGGRSDTVGACPFCVPSETNSAGSENGITRGR